MGCKVGVRRALRRTLSLQSDQARSRYGWGLEIAIRNMRGSAVRDNLKHRTSAARTGLYLFLVVLLTFWSGMGVVRTKPRRVCDRITQALAKSTGQKKTGSKQLVNSFGMFEMAQREIGWGG